MARRSSEERVEQMLQEFRASQARKREQKKAVQRWRQSRRGKARLRKKYEERKAWLDGLKVEKGGCSFCGEKNPALLRFEVQKGEKAKFLPDLKNISRSQQDWLRVIELSDILCENCLMLRKAARMTTRARRAREARQVPLKQGVNGPLQGDLSVPRSNYQGQSCGFCGRPLTKKGKQFCSDRHRLLSWAMKEIIKAYRSGQADGLRGIIAELAEIRG